MIYEYDCDYCGKLTQLNLQMKEDIPAQIKCSCGKKADRVWSNISVKIPEYMKATEINSNSGNTYETLKQRMKHGTRPSGKQKTLY